jgi:hypothetical protein
VTRDSSIALWIAAALLLFSTTAHVKNRFMVDYDNAPAATVSGRIIAHHKAPKGSELRAADGPFLNLDTPLLTANTDDPDQCFEWSKIVILSDDPGWQNGSANTGLKGKIKGWPELISLPVFVAWLKA